MPRRLLLLERNETGAALEVEAEKYPAVAGETIWTAVLWKRDVTQVAAIGSHRVEI
jgi:hypothetical protein